jgi:hypothetical protein
MRGFFSSKGPQNFFHVFLILEIVTLITIKGIVKFIVIYAFPQRINFSKEILHYYEVIMTYKYL